MSAAQLEELSKILEHMEEHSRSLRRLGMRDAAEVLEVTAKDLDDRFYAMGSAFARRRRRRPRASTRH